MSSDKKVLKSEDTVVFLSKPEIRGNEWRYVKDCLDTGWVSSVGSYVERFEQAFAQYVGARYAIATTNGTAALHVALLLAGVEPDDEVLVSTLTFIAPANAIRYVEAWPVFMDADPRYWQMDSQKVADFLKRECHFVDGVLRNRSTGRRVRAILPVHILGHPVDMDPIVELAGQYHLEIIEDATESLGARYRGMMVGTRGSLACFSFNGNKLITTGGGGMIVTNNQSWASKARYLTTQAKDDPVAFVHNTIGYNYRLTNVQAAIGCAQLERIEKHLKAKRAIASTYRTNLNEARGIVPMPEADWAQSAFWLYTILLPESVEPSWLSLVASLGRRGIQSRPLWQPLHRSPAHSGSQAYHCEGAEAIQRRALSLPSSVDLTMETQRLVIETVLDTLSHPK